MKASDEDVRSFLGDKPMQELIARTGWNDEFGYVYPNPRQMEIAIKARRIMADAIETAMVELSVNPDGYDLNSAVDIADFLRGMQAGVVLAAIDIGGVMENVKFFEAVSKIDAA